MTAPEVKRSYGKRDPIGGPWLDDIRRAEADLARAERLVAEARRRRDVAVRNAHKAHKVSLGVIADALGVSKHRVLTITRQAERP